MLGKIFDPRAWFSGTDEVDEALQKMAEGPRLADLWNVERKLLERVQRLGWRCAGAALEHNTVMLEAWTRAAGAFAKDAERARRAGRELESWREMLALWVETAKTTLLETQRSEAS